MPKSLIWRGLSKSFNVPVDNFVDDPGKSPKTPDLSGIFLRCLKFNQNAIALKINDLDTFHVDQGGVSPSQMPDGVVSRKCAQPGVPAQLLQAKVHVRTDVVHFSV